MRSYENPAVTNKGFNRGLSFREWWVCPKFKIEHDKFIALLGGELVSAQGIELVKAEAIVRVAVSLFVTEQSQITPKRAGSLLEIRRVAVKFMEKLLPEHLFEFLRRLKSTIFVRRSVPIKGDLGSLAELKRITTPPRFLMSDELIAELSAIEALIAGFYTARMKQSK